MVMTEITVIDVESKELKKWKKKKLKKKKTNNNKKSGYFRNMSTDHKAQKQSYASRSVGILFLSYFVFALKLSVAG